MNQTENIEQCLCLTPDSQGVIFPSFAVPKKLLETGRKKANELNGKAVFEHCRCCNKYYFLIVPKDQKPDQRMNKDRQLTFNF